jgi:transcriptional regulator with XRE-family HTH domain
VAAGYSSAEAFAAKLGFDRSVIAKAETGDRPPTQAVADAIEAELAGVFPDGFVGRMAELARKHDGPIPTWFEAWLEAERTAQMLQIWQPLLIPGLFQTADYSRALFMAVQSDTSDDAIDALVSARTERAFILNRPNPPDVACVVDEHVLNRMIGSADVMAEALNHLADMSERPNIVIQVVPAGNGASAGLGGAFDIATVDGAPEVVRSEATVADVTSENRGSVRKAQVAFSKIRADALPRVQSRTLIREATERWKEH